MGAVAAPSAPHRRPGLPAVLDSQAVGADGGARVSHRSRCRGEDPGPPGIADVRTRLGAGKLRVLAAVSRAGHGTVLESGSRVYVAGRGCRLRLRGERRSEVCCSITPCHPTAAVRFRGEGEGPEGAGCVRRVQLLRLVSQGHDHLRRPAGDLCRWSFREKCDLADLIAGDCGTVATVLACWSPSESLIHPVTTRMFSLQNSWFAHRRSVTLVCGRSKWGKGACSPQGTPGSAAEVRLLSYAVARSAEKGVRFSYRGRWPQPSLVFRGGDLS